MLISEADICGVFPNKSYTSIGCGSDIECISPKKLKFNLDSWLEDNGIDFSDAKFEAAMLNYDYRGYKFGNIFLAGDAAGLISGFLGKGIYPAIVSGKQIANDILGNKCRILDIWLRKKKLQEKFMFFLKRNALRKIALSASIKLMNINFFQRNFLNLIL